MKVREPRAATRTTHPPCCYIQKARERQRAQNKSCRSIYRQTIPYCTVTSLAPSKKGSKLAPVCCTVVLCHADGQTQARLLPYLPAAEMTPTKTAAVKYFSCQPASKTSIVKTLPQCLVASSMHLPTSQWGDGIGGVPRSGRGNRRRTSSAPTLRHESGMIRLLGSTIQTSQGGK